MRASWLALLAPAACGTAASSDPGLGLFLRVEGAQLAKGPLPASNGGPAVTTLEIQRTQILAGEAGIPIQGRAAAGSFGIQVGLEAEPAHWLLPIGLPDAVVTDELTWSARLDFSRESRPGPALIHVVAVGADGRVGEPTSTRFLVGDDTPTGALVFSLSWDREVDLDLHVLTPTGIDVSAKRPSSYQPPPPGRPPDPPNAWMQGGLLDQDSNAGCLIDGRRLERITWKMDPPKGTYKVFADLFSACGQPGVSFIATTYRDGLIVRRAGSRLYEYDARLHPAPPGDAPGLYLFEIEVQ